VGVQRRVFRVEQMFAVHRRAAPNGALVERRDDDAEIDAYELERELVLLREMLARNKQDLAALFGRHQDRRMVRAAGELGAAVDAMEQATQAILHATETIDDNARSLGSALKHKHEAELAQDIQDHAVKIFEACNFQDLAGQRIGNVLKTLAMVEDQIAGMLERCKHIHGPSEASAKASAAGARLINGPRLDGDSGHADQNAIDTLFD
jgi:chemotaxis protein CheZ